MIEEIPHDKKMLEFALWIYNYIHKTNITYPYEVTDFPIGHGCLGNSYFLFEIGKYLIQFDLISSEIGIIRIAISKEYFKGCKDIDDESIRIFGPGKNSTYIEFQSLSIEDEDWFIKNFKKDPIRFFGLFNYVEN